jgi:small subunit ribosomal protein S19
MCRAKWKNNFISSALLRGAKKSKIWSRTSTILPAFLNRYVYVYTGKEFKKFLVTREKIGYKYGQFCLTRVLKSRVKKQNKKNVKKKKL